MLVLGGGLAGPGRDGWGQVGGRAAGRGWSVAGRAAGTAAHVLDQRPVEDGLQVRCAQPVRHSPWNAFPAGRGARASAGGAAPRPIRSRSTSPAMLGSAGPVAAAEKAKPPPRSHNRPLALAPTTLPPPPPAPPAPSAPPPPATAPRVPAP